MALALEEQLTINELLKDSIFREWMKKIPSVGSAICPSGKPWRVWIKARPDRAWACRDFVKYAEAYNFFAKMVRKGIHDGAITCKIKEFRPPVVRDKALGGKKRYHIPAQIGQNPQHEWCTYCRRPTIFTYFKHHHSHPVRVNDSERRCAICGIRLVAIKHYQ